MIDDSGLVAPMKRGAVDTPVKSLQRRLEAGGVPVGTVDGKFGPSVEQGVRDWQMRQGFTVDDPDPARRLDGIVGGGTWSTLPADPLVICETPELSLPPSRPLTPTFLLINESSLSDAEVQKAADGCLEQVNDHAGDFWGYVAEIKVGTDADRDGIAFVIRIVDSSSVANALGWHSVDVSTADWDAYGEVSIEVGEAWTITLSHEILEILGDRMITTYEKLTRRGNDGGLIVEDWLKELCDPVQRYAYRTRNGTLVSDFVLPAWWGDSGEPRYSWLGVVTRPYEIAPGGYQIVLNPVTGEWSTRFAAQPAVEMRAARLELPTSVDGIAIEEWSPGDGTPIAGHAGQRIRAATLRLQTPIDERPLTRK